MTKLIYDHHLIKHQVNSLFNAILILLTQGINIVRDDQ